MSKNDSKTKKTGRKVGSKGQVAERRAVKGRRERYLRKLLAQMVLS